MNPLYVIRKRLGLTQAALAEVMHCTQSNVSFYEKGTVVVPPTNARRLIAYAATKGVQITFDDIYADPTPDEAPPSGLTPLSDKAA